MERLSQGRAEILHTRICKTQWCRDKGKRAYDQLFYRLQVGSEGLSVQCLSYLLRNIARHQSKKFPSSSLISELGRNDMTKLGEWVWGRVGKCCLCRSIVGYLVVDSLPSSLIRTVKFQVSDSSLYANSAFSSCKCWATNAIIDGRCQFLRWMEINT